MARVVTPFRDRETWRAYAVGDEWDGTQERLRELCEGGYVDSGLIAHSGEENVSESPSAPQTANLEGLTVAQLRDMCAERGIEVPKRVTKAKLQSLLEG